MSDSIDIALINKQTKIWSLDVGNLCKGLTNGGIQRINKWSVKKPIRSSLKILEDSTIFFQNGAGMKVNLWDGVKSNISFYSFLNKISNSIDDSWEYLNPRGINYKEYFRLNDYYNYSSSRNNSILNLNENTATYNLSNSDTINRQNWDSYSLDNVGDQKVLKMSDIWLSTSQTNNLGEFWLIVYVKDTNTNRHFFKKIKKLSDQNISGFSIEIPLEELFQNQSLIENKLFTKKEGIERYYFLADNVRLSDTWFEFTGEYNSNSQIDIAPNTYATKYNLLLNLFINCIAIPLTTNSKKSKSTSDIDFTTTLNLVITNTLSETRNLFIRINKKGGEFFYLEVLNLSPLEVSTIHIPNINSDLEGSIQFENCYKNDKLDVKYNGNIEIANSYSLTGSSTTITISNEDILNNIEESIWNTSTIEISLTNIT